MKSSSPIISAVVFGLSVFLLLMFGLGSSPLGDDVASGYIAPQESPQTQPERELHEQFPTVRPGFEGLKLDPPTLVTASYRKSASAALTGLIVDEEGVTLAGADLIWVSLEEDSPGLQTTTQQEGRFCFESVPSQLRDEWSAVWILHPSHYAEVIVLEPGEDARIAFGGTQRLKAAPLFSVAVVDEVEEGFRSGELTGPAARDELAQEEGKLNKLQCEKV